MRFVLIILLLVFCPRLAAADESAAAKQFKQLVAEYEEEGGARLFVRRFLAIAQQDKTDPVALDALLWVVENVPGRAETEQAISLLEQQHVESDKFGPGCKLVARSRTLGAEKLLRKAMAKNKDKQIQALACVYLAELLTTEAGIVEQLIANPSLAPRVLQYYGKPYGKHLAALKRTELAKERETVYERMLKSYGDVKINNVKIEDKARSELFAIRRLAIGKTAPEIKGQDIFGVDFKLTDYRGKVVMLSFWAHW